MTAIRIEECQSKPFLKWVGGKTQILDKVLSLFPEEVNNYFEPFLGGGSVLIELLSRVKRGDVKLAGNVFAYDLNSDLITVYKHVQNYPRRLLEEIIKLKTEYESCGNEKPNRSPQTKEEAIRSEESYYYYIRECFNKEEKGTIKSSAMFIFLNKTCFRGVYRIGPNGFNVPFGHYKNPAIIDASNILELSELFQNVQFSQSSFEDCPFWKDSNEKDFVYLDPPYAPETITSFVAYNKDGFSLEDHQTLFNLCNNTNVDFLLSNSAVPLVLTSFPIDRYTIETISCKRSINPKDPSKRTDEVLIKPKRNS